MKKQRQERTWTTWDLVGEMGICEGEKKDKAEEGGRS